MAEAGGHSALAARLRGSAFPAPRDCPRETSAPLIAAVDPPPCWLERAPPT